MATEQQLAANRRNAQLSTGPRSVEGKAASSRNAVKTGLYAQAAVIPGKENPEDLEELQAAFAAEHQPATATEQALLDALVHYEWLLRRYRWVEADVWRAAQEGLFCDYRKTEIWAGHAFVDEQAISRLHRLRNQTQRLFHETLAELRKAKAARQPIEEPAPNPEIGFVPSNPEDPVEEPRSGDQSPVPSPRPPVPFPQPPSGTLALQTD